RHRADRADAIETELDLKFRAQRFERVEVVDHAGRSFAMHAPEPAGRRRSFQRFSYRAGIERLAPRKFDRIKVQLPTPRFVNQPVSEFAIAQNDAALLLERKLAADDVVRKRAGADEQLRILRGNQFAQNLP